MRKFLFIVGAVALASSSAFAVHETKSDKLKALYEAAPKPAVIGDFDLLGDQQSKQNCGFFELDDSFSETSIKGYIYNPPMPQEKAGPLFPTPPAPGSVLVLLFGSVASTPQLQDHFASYVTFKYGASALEMNVAPESRISDSPWRISFKKDATYIYFKLDSYVGIAGSETTRYGYCWRE